jgi:DNA-directed RNA polymerase specialized sigma24 family protein
VHRAESKKKWVLTPDAFHRLLAWLDQGIASDGEKYLEMRRRLVSYFSRKRCTAPDELADETLNRVARRLQEEGSIDTAGPAHYCYVVARFVLLESFRKPKPQSLDGSTLLARTNSLVTAPALNVEQEEQERRWQCFQQCIASISVESRELIINYYYGNQATKIQNRRLLAEKLDITVNALSIRAWRIRSKLEACVKRCVKEG